MAAKCLSCLLVLCWAVSSAVEATSCPPANWSRLLARTMGSNFTTEFRELILKPLMNHTRVPGTKGNELARKHIESWMKVQYWLLEEDHFYSKTGSQDNVSFTSVIATLKPSAPRRLVLACHYDTLKGLYEATDGAVPCSVLMDIAFRMKNIFHRNLHRSKSDITPQFVFFDGMENNWSSDTALFGSRHLASLWAKRTGGLTDIDTLIVLNHFGSSRDKFGKVYDATTEMYTRLNEIEICLLRGGHLARTGEQPRLFDMRSIAPKLISNGDHLPFYNRGVPVLPLYSHPLPSAWHSGSDRISSLDFGRIDYLSSILRVFLAERLALI